MQIIRSPKVHSVIVIGSGASGGMAAWNLTRQGIDVLLLDAGTRFDRATYWTHVRPWEARERRARGQSPPTFFLDTKEQPYAAPDGQHFDLYRVWGHGGKTNIWGRVSLRLSDLDFKGPAKDGWEIPWPISYADISPYYDQVEQLIGVCGGNDDSDSLPGSGFLQPPPAPRCAERLLQKAAKGIGVDIVAGRRANMTKPTRGFPACHHCGNCGAGCDTASFFNSADHLLPFALKTGRLEIRSNAVAARILVDDKGRAKGVQYFDRQTGAERQALAKVVVVGASCVDSTRLLLNSKSTAYSNGIGNSSDVIGRYLCEQIRFHIRGWLPPLAGTATRNDRGIGGEHIYLPRFNHRDGHRRDYLRGFGMQFWNTGASDTGAHGGSDQIPGFGLALKQEIKRRHPAWFEMHPYGEVLPYAHNRITVGDAGEDRYGVPVVKIDYKIGDNERKMAEHMADTAEAIAHAAGAELVDYKRADIDRNGSAIHEHGTCRMGADPKRSALNNFNRMHDVPNVYVVDGSAFPTATEKNPTLTILALSWRATDHLAEELKGAADAMQVIKSPTVYPVIVIGSGAAGGMAAWNLTQKGVQVLMLDAGDKFDRGKFWTHVRPWEARERRAKGDAPQQFYLDTKEQPYKVPDGKHFDLTRVWGLGGKTNVWGRVSLRLSEMDFKAAASDGWEIPWPISYADISPYYDKVEQMIGVCGGDDDSETLPGSKFLQPAPAPRCAERLMQKGAKSLGIDIVAGRRANMTKPTRGFPPCHYCGGCGAGCDTASFFCSADHLIPFAVKTGKLEIRPNAVAGRVLVDDKGKARGVQYFDRKTGAEHEVLGKVVIVAASCVDSTRILLNSKSTAYPNGIGNSSDVIGRYLCEQIRLNAVGWMPALAGGPTRNDRGIGGEHVYLRRFNHKAPHKRDYLRGFGVQFWNTGASDTGAHNGSETIPGFGAALKTEIKRRHPTWVEIHPFGEALPYANNRITVGGAGEDRYGVPLMTISYEVGENERKMTEHMADTIEELAKASGVELVNYKRGALDRNGSAIHEHGTCRMGEDPKRSALNKFNQMHDVSNVFVVDGSSFASATEKNPTLTILSLSWRATDYLADQMKQGVL